MSNTFMNSPRLLFTSESVTEGHPDKLCDQVSDAVLDAILDQDPFGRVAAEAATTQNLRAADRYVSRLRAEGGTENTYRLRLDPKTEPVPTARRARQEADLVVEPP